MTIGEFLGVVSLNQDVDIFDGNGESLYRGANALVPSDIEEKYINSVWVNDETNELAIEADYFIGEEWED